MDTSSAGRPATSLTSGEVAKPDSRELAEGTGTTGDGIPSLQIQCLGKESTSSSLITVGFVEVVVEILSNGEMRRNHLSFVVLLSDQAAQL